MSPVQLLPHQREALQHALATGGNSILAHATGSGKGLTSLAIAERLRAEGTVQRVLVIAPASLRFNYFNQVLKKFAPSRKSVFIKAPYEKGNVEGGLGFEAITPSYDYYVMSGALLRLLGADAVYRKIQPDLIIADEVHEARNQTTGYYRELKALRDKVGRFLGLTGSPSSNSPGDLAALLNLARGTDMSNAAITSRYFKKVPVKAPVGLLGIRKKTIGHNLVVRNQGRLASEISRYMHVVSKEQVDASAGDRMPYPHVTREKVEVPMSPVQEKFYQFAFGKVDPKIRERIRNGLPVSQKEATHVFSQITAARQASNAIHLFNSQLTPEDSVEHVPKIQRLLQDVSVHLKTTPDARIIIYTHMIRGGVDVVEAGLKKLGLPYVTFTGPMSPRTKSQAEEAFRSGQSQIIIVSQAGEKGLNFPDTTFVAMLDGHFNPEKLYQAESRGIRAGGQAHRPPHQRHVIVKYYTSVLPNAPSRAGQMLGRFTGGTRTVEQWMQSIANTKAEQNALVKQAIASQGVTRSASAQMLPPPAQHQNPYLN